MDRAKTGGLILVIIWALAMYVSADLAFADTDDLKVAGWIPYWQGEEGARDTRRHLSDIDTIHPFVYTVKNDGSLNEMDDLDDRDWERLFDRAEDKDVEIIPTVMWSDGARIHAVLSDDDLREDHIEAIADMVDDGNFDGVDIDYESKWAETKDYFSLFLEELKDELGSHDLLTCTVEARTPPESLYHDVPAVIQRANDYEEMAEHCDRIEIMAYDQQRADLLLNDAKKGEPYFPVADADWVRKVIEYALEDIPAEKIMLGIPTYGYHYQVNVSPDWYRSYERIGALNMPDILDIADEYDVEPGRNKAGELYFSYFPDSSVYKLLKVLPVPEGTSKGNEAAAQALLFATMANTTAQVRIISLADAVAAKEKVELAKEYGLRGVAFFKFDGEQDEEIWDLIE